MSIHTRRVGEFVWVRLGDYMMPNVDQFAPTSHVPSEELEFGPPYMTAWTVPVDDTHTMSFQHPQLAEALPQPSTDTWRLNPDGSMQTRYRLKPNLTWQDATPLNAEDFVFAHRVYKTPELGVGSTSPIAQMDDNKRNIIGDNARRFYPSLARVAVPA